MSEDLIRRSDAIKHFKEKADHYRKRLANIKAQGDAISYDPTDQIKVFEDEIIINEDVVKEIKGIPSAEPKQGEWIDKGVDYDGTWYYQCSKCSASVENVEYPHCPYCLARMKGADDE